MGQREELVAKAFHERYLLHEDYPLNLYRIAWVVEKKLDIEIHFHWLPLSDGVTARLIGAPTLALIYINSLHSIPRQRFGVCHEFGHLVLEHRGGILQPGIGESEREKEEANSFAAALLMPDWLVWSLGRNCDSLISLVKNLAVKAGVTVQAAARRLAETDIYPGLWVLIDPLLQRTIWEYHSVSIHLDYQAFQSFLVRQLRLLPGKQIISDSNIMGYPFRVESRSLWGKRLITCLPFAVSRPGVLAGRQEAT